MKNDNLEKESINELRRFNKKIILIINKDDNLEKNSLYPQIGFEKLFYISCSHNLGFEELYEYFEKNDQGIINDYKIQLAYSFDVIEIKRFVTREMIHLTNTI